MSEEQSNSEGNNAGNTNNSEPIGDVRITNEDVALLKEFISKSQKPMDRVEVADASKDIVAYVNEIKELKASNKELQEEKRVQLLEFLNPKDREKYKDKSLEDLSIIAEYIRDHPQKGGLPRYPSSKDKKQKETKAPTGRIGSRYDNWGKDKKEK